MSSRTGGRRCAAAFTTAFALLLLVACASGNAPAQKKAASGPVFEIEGDPATAQGLADLMCGGMSDSEAVLVKQGAAMSSFQCAD